MSALPSPRIRHQQLLVTIYGLYGRSHGGELPISVLIAMLGDLGYDAPGVRSSVSRLKSKGILHSVGNRSRAKYALSDSVIDIFRDGDKRIFAPERSTPADRWVLAIFSVPEAIRNRRHQLRSELTGLGFGTVGSGVWIAPHNIQDEARKHLAERGLDNFVEFFDAEYLFAGNMGDKVASWWDLDSLDALYSEFLEIYGNAPSQWIERMGEDPSAALAAAGAEDLRDAFRCYVPMLTMWRRFPYRDPNLPLEYLPQGWKAPRAKNTFLAMHRMQAPLAAKHAEQLLALKGALDNEA